MSDRPLISAEHRNKVASFVEGDFAFRGDTPAGPGFWYPTTVLGPMGNDTRQAQEEIFGPVMCVIPRVEDTKYQGRHYVEVYVVRNGQVVASDHHDVVIK